MESPSTKDNMRQYLLYSGSLHAAAAVLLFIFIRPALNNIDKSTMYSVDFIGAQEQTVQSAPPAAAAQPAPEAQQPVPVQAQQPEQIQPKPQPDAILLNAKKPKPAALQKVSHWLPSPSILRQLQKPSILAAMPQTQQPAQTASVSETAGTSTAQAGGTNGVSADFPNFPYPWYISRVRASLWNEWSSRMPHGGVISAVVTFKIARGGTAQNITIEKTSSNKLFDFAALASVEQSAPFPPLPADYRQDLLTVHVEFKSTQ